MATVSEMLARFEAFDVIAAGRRAIEDNKDAVLDKNRKQLYEEGVDSQGQKLPTYAGALGGSSAVANQYFEEKKMKNSRVNGNPSYDFKNTGETLRTLKVEVSGSEYRIIPQTSYAYDPAGYPPFGVSPKSNSELWIERTRSSIVGQLSAATGCTTT